MPPDLDLHALPNALPLDEPEHKEPVILRDFGDSEAVRHAIYDRTLKSAQSVPDVSNAKHTLHLSDVAFDGPPDYSLKEQKRAILEGRTLSRRLKGTLTLTDNATGKPIATKRTTLANVPYFSPRGTFILNGSEYTLCLHGAVQIWTEQGMLPIRKIVESKMPIKVWSYDFALGKFVLKPVISWYKNKVQQDLGRAQFFAPGRFGLTTPRFCPTTLWGTPGHNVYTPWGTTQQLKDAKYLTVVEESLSYSQEQLLYGSLLGDATVDSDGLFRVSHCLAQSAYLQLKHDIFGELAPLPPSDYADDDGHLQRRFYTRAHVAIRHAYAMCYPGGEKQVSVEWLSRLDEMGLAFWYLDDGNIRYTRNTNHLDLSLHTQGFNRKSVALLQDWLSAQWGLDSYIERNDKYYRDRDLGWIIKLTSNDAERFLDLVAPFIPDCMRYKLARRPQPGHCRRCSRELLRTRRTCSQCFIAEYKTGSPTYRSNHRKSALRRFGSKGGIAGAMVATSLPETTGCEAWEARDRVAGKAVPAMLVDTAIHYRLNTTPCEFRSNTGAMWEKVRTVFDIEVADTHNYVANGVLVGNSTQMRLRPGVYTRIKENGELSSHINVQPGQGLSHHVELDPATGLFSVKFGSAHYPLVPILRAMGVTDSQLRHHWGDVAAANAMKADSASLDRLHTKIVRGPADPDVNNRRQAVAAALQQMPLDPEVTARTLGHPFTHVGPDVYLAATKKLLALSRREVEPDDRDHLAFMTVHGPEDLISERFLKDKGVLRRALWKATLRGNLDGVTPGLFSKSLQEAITGSGLGQPGENVNLLQVLEQQGRISRMGVGALPSVDSIPDESRSLQPSHLGFIDFLATPESMRAGVDSRVASNAKKGSDGRIYAPFTDVRTGETQMKSPADLADKVVAFPGELRKNTPTVAAMVDGRIKFVPRQSVDYELPHMEGALGPLSNLVPMKSAVKGQRAAMGQRMTAQALPLVDAEAPLVQTGIPGSNNDSYEQVYGKYAGALRSEHGGRVVEVTPDKITLQTPDGKTVEHELLNNFPSNRKTSYHQTALVQPGQVVQPGQLLAKSNYTDANGQVALGKNARVAYIPYFGPGSSNFEDAWSVSRSFADRMLSEHMYQHSLDHDDGLEIGKRAHVSLFPGKYPRQVLDNFDDAGVIKPGTVVNEGDPLILAVKKRELSRDQVYRGRERSYVDKTESWEHHSPGVVTDVANTPSGVLVTVKTHQPMQVGDKLSGRYGDKGLVGTIVPDADMPQDAHGQPFEVLANPLGLMTRTNSAQMVEAALGKIADRTGHPYRVQDFHNVPDLTEFAAQELARHGLTDQETIYDPKTGRPIPNVFTGKRFFMKLHHTSESKNQGRGVGGYTAEATPAKGGTSGAKRLSLMSQVALLSHGATAVARDGLIRRGQADPDFWLQFMSGHTPPTPKIPFVHEKFINTLKSAGINVIREGTRLNVKALTDHDIDQLTEGRILQNAETVDWKNGLKPVVGGLFDEGLTGGHAGKKWSQVPLAEPMPNPVFEDPIRRVLGLTEKRFRDVLAGREDLNSQTGPQAIHSALDRIDLPRLIAQTREESRLGRKGIRDMANRRLGYLKSAQQAGLHPRDWVWTKAPVLPPIFRRVSVMAGNGRPMVADPNFLYQDLWHANENLKGMKERTTDVGVEREALYDALKAVAGLGDPVQQKTEERGVKGAIKSITGNSPKWGMVQRKLLSSAVDLVGRSVIVPDPDLDMDSVGLPEKRAWDVYTPFVVRRLVRRGMPRVQAVKEAEGRTPVAKKALLEEMGERPVILDRAPVLHRAGFMAFRPQLVHGDAIHMPQLVYKGYGADNDGDQVNYQVPLSDDAVRDAYEKMLPSRNLLSPANFKVHQVPSMENAGGLYAATAPVDETKRPIRFATKKDAIRAYKRGEIAPDQSVIVDHA